MGKVNYPECCHEDLRLFNTLENAINLFNERMQKATREAQDRLKAQGRQIGKWIPKHPKQHPESNTRLAKRKESEPEREVKAEDKDEKKGQEKYLNR